MLSWAMTQAPTFPIDLAAFTQDPFPALAEMRARGPVWHVPELGATLFVRRDDIFAQEKRIETFSSRQPEGLMTRIMGENMMRKDGPAHLAERRACLPALAPRTIKAQWREAFEAETRAVLDALRPRGRADLVAEFAAPVSGHALRHVTGLTTMTWQEIDQTSQAMIDGISNYHGEPATEARAHAAVALIDSHIARRLPELRARPDSSLLSVQLAAGLTEAQAAANVRLAISGGQNEPRDAIAGTIWALLTHPEALAGIRAGRHSWAQAFEEYARWVPPIMMSPRQVARPDRVAGVDLVPGARVFFMFGSANHDEAHFDHPERYDIARDTSAALTFGAGPHFCAGAAVARSLIAEVALPLAFDALPGLRLEGPVAFSGWAFRGPQSVPVAWEA